MVDCRKLARESGRLSERRKLGRISKEIEEELAVNPSVESLREKTLNRLRQEKAELSARKVLEINQLANNVDKLKIIESKIIAGGKDKKAIVKSVEKYLRDQLNSVDFQAKAGGSRANANVYKAAQAAGVEKEFAKGDFPPVFVEEMVRLESTNPGGPAKAPKTEASRPYFEVAQAIHKELRTVRAKIASKGGMMEDIKNYGFSQRWDSLSLKIAGFDSFFEDMQAAGVKLEGRDNTREGFKDLYDKLLDPSLHVDPDVLLNAVDLDEVGVKVGGNRGRIKLGFASTGKRSVDIPAEAKDGIARKYMGATPLEIVQNNLRHEHVKLAMLDRIGFLPENALVDLQKNTVSLLRKHGIDKGLERLSTTEKEIGFFPRMLGELLRMGKRAENEAYVKVAAAAKNIVGGKALACSHVMMLADIPTKAMADALFTQSGRLNNVKIIGDTFMEMADSLNGILKVATGRADQFTIHSKLTGRAKELALDAIKDMQEEILLSMAQGHHELNKGVDMSFSRRSTGSGKLDYMSNVIDNIKGFAGKSKTLADDLLSTGLSEQTAHSGVEALQSAGRMMMESNAMAHIDARGRSKGYVKSLMAVGSQRHKSFDKLPPMFKERWQASELTREDWNFTRKTLIALGDTGTADDALLDLNLLSGLRGMKSPAPVNLSNLETKLGGFLQGLRDTYTINPDVATRVSLSIGGAKDSPAALVLSSGTQFLSYPTSWTRNILMPTLSQGGFATLGTMYSLYIAHTMLARWTQDIEHGLTPRDYRKAENLQDVMLTAMPVTYLPAIIGKTIFNKHNSKIFGSPTLDELDRLVGSRGVLGATGELLEGDTRNATKKSLELGLQPLNYLTHLCLYLLLEWLMMQVLKIGY